MKRKVKLARNVIPPLVMIMTDHAVLRMRERMPDDFAFPAIGTYIRLLTMKDTLHDNDLALLRLKGGVILGKWKRNALIVVTMFSNSTFHRLQQRQKSRFQPVDSACYLVDQILYPDTQNAT
jgi:hypothetical protein